ncbi:hypothetical protein SAY86_026070 [Trapa natans]|uniref:Uncharacterized protein n=1 Tax=Trapa natans TaxID=22666 RepID=A0AAN7KL27_TRANT|nr:hypothetical protein SAY86_026070 [Trapa natans]
MRSKARTIFNRDHRWSGKLRSSEIQPQRRAIRGKEKRIQEVKFCPVSLFRSGSESETRRL